uniref:5-bromo-4-chloroindolyl phosphate hydrolysis protein n=1 Tax=Globodera pallida TaxID=36090 RepID=A0A183BXZ4_GLOPA
MDRTTYKDAVVATGALGIGVGLAATQFGLLIGSAATNLMLDCLISTKNAGKDALNRGLSIEQAIEERIRTAIGATQEIAEKTRKNPGEVLLQIIRFYSSKLNNQMGKLRDRSSELLSSSLQTQIQSLTMYVQKLDDNFAKAESIDDVKQEVIEEAKQKLFDIARWSASLSLRGPSKDTAAEDEDNDDEPKQHLQEEEGESGEEQQ